MLVRITLCLDNPHKSEELAEALEGQDVVISILESDLTVQYLSKDPCDILLLSESKIPSPAEDTLATLDKLPDSPTILLLTNSEDERMRAHFLATGCDAVFHAKLPTQALVDAIKMLLRKRTQQQNGQLREQRLLAEPRLTDFVSNSASMRAFMNLTKRVVRSDSSLLILGETGVGKERLALAIHSEGKRKGKPFIPINCAALPDTLLESELFGHEQGAYTGATRARRGAFELAHNGTIFLDEIGDMPLPLQAKLLRVLQDRQFAKLGGEKRVHVNIRVMAATNRDLAAEVEAGRFRRDLYYRLSVVTLLIPPLRERHEDIPELIQSYLEYLSPRIGVEIFSISPEAVDALTKYNWPGNVRELINVLERAMLLCEGNEITLTELPDEIAIQSTLPIQKRMAISLQEEILKHWLNEPWKTVRRRALDHIEQFYLHEVLNQNNGSIANSAAQAGISTRALYDKMQKYTLQKEDYKSI